MDNTAEKKTELKIKETARKMFQRKGFSGTKTRDIAKEAGINLALLNYYYRSKQKLYDIIMVETIRAFFSDISQILDDSETSLHEKVDMLVTKYIDMLSKNLDIPMFIVNELRTNPKGFVKKIGVFDKIKRSICVRQFHQAVASGKIPPINPIHFIMNLSSLIVFPFMSIPIIAIMMEVEEKKLIQLMQERKKFIPLWKDAMFKVR